MDKGTQSIHKKRIAILGSTGSIGTQALEVIEQYPRLFEVEVLTAHSNVDLLISQAKKYKPNAVVIVKEDQYNYLQDILDPLGIKVYAGSAALEQIVQMGSIDMVLTAMVGFAGLAPTIQAIQAGKAIALANKETLVVAGELVMKMAMEHQVPIIPVDSEHSAIFQCLVGEDINPVGKIILTASGGPFRTKTLEEIQKVSLKEALRHPNWSMGDKITIDSATMMNKVFEIIEAKKIFDLSYKQLEILIHPKSYLHAIVKFNNGLSKLLVHDTNMTIPIFNS
ncbi:MAG: 1-deoxy-D-xylulose-5-phosphate reductoisomerase, partial [Bacteroidetes bacterium]|nr:1-deoxy-D-xylulose-5-phosphate reductoisomerase [Bacteroidota bacterium]